MIPPQIGTEISMDGGSLGSKCIKLVYLAEAVQTSFSCDATCERNGAISPSHINKCNLFHVIKIKN
jgi:hypothetical protein